jgi:hypothetical protein
LFKLRLRFDQGETLKQFVPYEQVIFMVVYAYCEVVSRTVEFSLNISILPRSAELHGGKVEISA